MAKDKSEESSRSVEEYQGPLKDRSCTDIPCLLVFLCCIVCWIGVGMYAVTQGDWKNVSIPRDSHGLRCGIDEEVINKPFLMIFDLGKCISGTCRTPQVCVEQCPNSTWYAMDDIGEESAITKELVKVEALSPIRDQVVMNSGFKDHLICENHVNITGKDSATLLKYVYAGVCAKWYLKSTPALSRCIPGIPIDDAIRNKTGSALVSGAEFLRNVLKLESIKDKLERSWQLILAFILGSILICVIYIALLRWIALPCVLTALLSLSGLLGYLAYKCYIETYRQDHWRGYLPLAIILGSLALIIIFLTLCLMKRIILACQLIGEAGKAIIHTLSTLFFPIIPWLLHLALFAAAICIGVFLVSMSTLEYRITENLPNGNCSCSPPINIIDNALCTPKEFFSNCKENTEYCFSISCNLYDHIYSPKLKLMAAIHVFGSIWVYLFITAMCEMILAGTFATWYFTRNKSQVAWFTVTTSAWRTIRYHLGTVAFGAFLITLCEMLKLVLKWLYTQTQAQAPKCQEFCKAFLCVSMCCVSVLEKFLKFMNRNAYIMCAVRGKGLCKSAANALSLLTRNLLRTIVINNIVDLLVFLGKLVVICLSAVLTWYYFKRSEIQKDPIDEEMWWVPVVFVAIGAYFVSNIFFVVLSTAADTIFLCFLEDCETNDGTREKPYYMSRSLGKLLRL